ncbi:helix-turn-helix transcriptional regulator [Aquimarina sp. TRL1]|uniref:ArsR/SmtB family transcription factor n=1 Tax=Aquimarina sp. (strain TRL1) TaxID=2736252 RepID=UPI001589DF35|nr:helix-turn-helix transcriptional regulator [Aquimarina sp. TRL1]
MDENNFITVASLLCEPSRAKIVWNLLDGRAYTASELALVSDLSPSSVMQAYYRKHIGKNSKTIIIKVARKLLNRTLAVIKTETPYQKGVLA